MAKRKYNVVPGQKVGMLTVLEEIIIYKYSRKNRFVRCLCKCGKETIQKVIDVFTVVKSCGCQRSENTRKMFTTHGYTHHPLYGVFTRMKSNCYNKRCKDYPYYGLRGIIICNEWLKNPGTFFNWAINNGYKPGLTIERVNNSGNYNPLNCIFTTRIHQVNNRRNNIIISYKNEKMSMADFCRKHGMKYQKFHDRIVRLNWPVEKAMNNCN